MKFPASKAARLSCAVAALALGLGACARSQHVSDSLTGPVPPGADPILIGGSGRAGDIDFAPTVPCPALVPATIDAPVKFVPTSGIVASFRSNRFRIETIGENAGPSLKDMGPCAASDAPSVRFIGGHADVLVHGTDKSVTFGSGPLTFGPLVSPGVLLERGVVFATTATNDVLEIIWPELAGLPPGDPIVRVQLGSWNTLLVSPAQAYDVVWDLTAERDGTQMCMKGHADNLRLDGIAVLQEGANFSPPACPETLAGTSDAIVPTSALIVQFRANRLRLDLSGDTPAGTVHASGLCATATPAPIQFVGGTANLFRAGTNISVTSTAQPLVFGALQVPQTLEPGVVLATDAAGDVLEIVWPALAGLPPGPPVLRLQLARWNSWVLTGRQVDVSMKFDAIGPDGVAASYTVAADSIVVPSLR